MSRSWDEVRALLDDPYVDGDTKEHLLAAYVAENYPISIGDDFELPPAEVQEYMDRYSLEGGDADQGSVDEVYARAERESGDRGYQHREAQRLLGESQSELDEMQPPGLTGSGVRTSDEVLELADPAFQMFETWLPINEMVPGDLLGHHDRISVEDVRERFDEQVGINFRKFLEDADRIRQAHTTLDGLNSTAEQQLNSVYQSWSGEAANASYQHYSEQIAPNVSNLLEALSAAPGVIEAVVDHVYEVCRAKVDAVIELYNWTEGSMGEAPPDVARTMMKLAGGEDVGDDELMQAVHWWDRAAGTELEEMADVLKDYARDVMGANARSWITQTFNVELHEQVLDTFEGICDDVLESINLAYEELNAQLSTYENEFSDASALQPPPPGPGPEGDGSTPGQGSDTGSPGPGSTGPGTGPGGSLPGPGGTIPSSSTPTTPELPGPGELALGTEDSQGTDASDAGDPSELGPGNQLRTPPDSGQRETVTIDDGDRQISVTSPDGQGKVTVTVDDGSGEPKTYELDFGDATGTGSAEPLAGEPRPMPVPTSQLPGGPGAGGGSGQFVPEESPTGQPVQAGPDGVAVIQDGDLTITAEHPLGSTDQVVVTVDDGTKDPTTYTLDYSDPVNPTATETPGRPVAQPFQAESVGTPGVARADQFVSGPAAQPAEPVPAAAGPVPSSPVPSAPLDIPGPVQGTAPQAAYAPESGFGEAGSVGAPDAGQYADAMSSDRSGEAGLATAPDTPSQPPSQSSGEHGAGLPMMAGMGAGAGGAGGDQDRPASQWRTSGDLFDDGYQEQADARLRGAFGENR